MIESRRLAYLNALGVPQFVARTAIEGAPTLPELSPEQLWGENLIESDQSEQQAQEPLHAREEAQPEKPQPEKPQQEKAQQNHPNKQPEQKAAPTPEQSPSSNSAEPSPRPTVPAETGETPLLDVSRLGLEKETKAKPVATPTKTAERFSLAIITVPEPGIRFIVQLGVADAPGLSGVEIRMLSDLLQALGYPQWLDQHQPQHFQWPFVNNPRIAKDRAAARDGLLGFFTSTEPVKKTLFLGGIAPAILDSQLEQNQSASTSVHGIDGESLLLPTLAQMSDWKIKANAWRQIQQFLK